MESGDDDAPRCLLIIPAWPSARARKTLKRRNRLLWEALQTARAQGLLTRHKRTRMPRQRILRQRFPMITSSWRSCGITLVEPRSIWEGVVGDTRHGC